MAESLNFFFFSRRRRHTRYWRDWSSDVCSSDLLPNRFEKWQAFDVVITEIGGTTGDIEGLPFLEAIRQFILEVGAANVVTMHVTLVPYINAAAELKTKPTQKSVAKLRDIELQPHVLICRTEKLLDRDVRLQLSMF